MILWFRKHDVKESIHITFVKFGSKLLIIGTLRGYMILFSRILFVLTLSRSQITIKLWITFTTQLRPLNCRNS